MIEWFLSLCSCFPPEVHTVILEAYHVPALHGSEVKIDTQLISGPAGAFGPRNCFLLRVLADGWAYQNLVAERMVTSTDPGPIAIAYARNILQYLEAGDT